MGTGSSGQSLGGVTSLKFLAHREGLEPPTHGSEDRCSNPLSYRCLFFELEKPGRKRGAFGSGQNSPQIIALAGVIVSWLFSAQQLLIAYNLKIISQPELTERFFWIRQIAAHPVFDNPRAKAENKKIEAELLAGKEEI